MLEWCYKGAERY